MNEHQNGRLMQKNRGTRPTCIFGAPHDVSDDSRQARQLCGTVLPIFGTECLDCSRIDRYFALFQIIGQYKRLPAMPCKKPWKGLDLLTAFVYKHINFSKTLKIKKNHAGRRIHLKV